MISINLGPLNNQKALSNNWVDSKSEIKAEK